MLEWCSDLFAEDYYGNSSEKDPQGPRTDIDSRVLRGGSCCDILKYCRSAYRGRNSPDGLDFNGGFRVVREAE